MAGCYPRPPLTDRFWSRVDKHGPVLSPKLGPCWLWTGAKDQDGYGQIWFENKQCKAHRIAWFLTAGEWPEPFALHRCDNPTCVRFSHLFQGTPKDNTDDMVEKGRASFLRGPWKIRCKRGHLRTRTNVSKQGACKLCIKELRLTTKYQDAAKERSRKWRQERKWKQDVAKKTTMGKR